MNRLCAGVIAVVTAGAFCVHAEAPVSQPEAPVELSGVFASADGATMELYQPGPSASVVLHINDPGSALLELTLKDTKESAPVGLRATTQFGGAPLTLIGDGPDLYGRTEVDGKVLEFLVGADGKMKTAVGGRVIQEPTTSAEIEASLVAADYAATWSSIQTMAFTVDAAGVKVRGAARPGFTQSVDRVFARTGKLSDERKKALEQASQDRQIIGRQVNDLRAVLPEQ